jgi:hypothetical protein
MTPHPLLSTVYPSVHPSPLCTFTAAAAAAAVEAVYIRLVEMEKQNSIKRVIGGGIQEGKKNIHTYVDTIPDRPYFMYVCTESEPRPTYSMAEKDKLDSSIAKHH